MNWKVLIALLLVAVAWIVLDSEPEAEQLAMVPKHLRGEWRTEDPSYAGRALELDAMTLAIDLGAAGDEERHPITGVEWSQLPDEIWYRVFYTDAGEPEEMTLRFVPTKDVLLLKTRPGVVWERAEKLRARALERAAERRREEEAARLEEEPFGEEFLEAFRGPIMEEEATTEPPP